MTEMVKTLSKLAKRKPLYVKKKSKWTMHIVYILVIVTMAIGLLLLQKQEKVIEKVAQKKFGSSISSSSTVAKIKSKQQLEAKKLFDQGWLQQQQGKIKEALENYNQAIKLDPEFSNAYINRGFLKFHQGRSKKALDDYNKAIELDPKNASAYSCRGVVRLSQQKLEKALKDFNKAIQLDSKFIDAYNYRGVVRFTQGKFKEALKDLNKVIELDSKYADAYKNRGFIFHKFNQYQKAIADWKNS